MEIDTVVVGDCLDVMRDIPNACIDLLFADPPYDLGFWDWVKGWVELLPRILKPDASLYICCGIGEKSDSLSQMLPIVKELFTFKNLITWKKQRGYGTQRNWMYTREEIIFAVNGPKYIFNPQYGKEKRHGYGFANLKKYPPKSAFKRVSNVWTDISEITKKTTTEWLRDNVAQKPEALLERIILASSDEGDLVFDPFVGTGTTAIVAKKLKRHYFACDINSDMIAVTNKRLENPYNPIMSRQDCGQQDSRQIQLF